MIHKIHNLNNTSTISTLSVNDVPNGIDILEEIFPEDGYKLTQAKDVPIQDRVIASACMLGKDCVSTEWKEITIEEAEEIIELQKQYHLEQEKLNEEKINESID